MKPYTWRAAILKSNLMPTTRHVLLTRSCYVNDIGQSAYPSTVTLASDTGLSERAVITHLHMARETGWLKIAKHGFGGQKWAHNEYFPCSPGGDYDEIAPEKGTEGGSVTDKKALNLKPKALNLTTEGTEPKCKKALKEVQSNYPIELSKELSKEHKAKAPAMPDMFSGVSMQVVDDFKKLRQTKKVAITQTAINGIKREADKAGITLEDALTICCERGWQGFKDAWMEPKGQSGYSAPAAKQSRHSGFDAIDYSEGIENGRIL